MTLGLQADISLRLILNFGLELFAENSDLALPPGTSNFEATLKFWDHQNRPLFLNAKVSAHFGGAVKIVVYSNFWIVNKTGLEEKMAETCFFETIVRIMFPMYAKLR